MNNRSLDISIKILIDIVDHVIKGQEDTKGYKSWSFLGLDDKLYFKESVRESLVKMVKGFYILGLLSK